MSDQSGPVLASLIADCLGERERLRERVADMEAGRAKFETLVDGRRWVDATQQEIEAVKATIAYLDRFLSKYDA